MNGKLKNIKVGDVLFREVKSGTERLLVTKVGRKYAYVRGLHVEHKIDLNDGWYRSDNYSQHNFQVYLSEEEIREQSIRRYKEKIVTHFFVPSSNVKKLNNDEINTIFDIISSK